MRYLCVVSLLLLAACSPTQPTPIPPPTEININAGNNDGNGGGGSTTPSPGSCSNVDAVKANVPPSINHGDSYPISISASLGGQGVVLNQACGAAAWLVGTPCKVDDVGAAKTNLTATATDLSPGCSVQACIGNVCSDIHLIPVN